MKAFKLIILSVFMAYPLLSQTDVGVENIWFPNQNNNLKIGSANKFTFIVANYTNSTIPSFTEIPLVLNIAGKATNEFSYMPNNDMLPKQKDTVTYFIEVPENMKMQESYICLKTILKNDDNIHNDSFCVNVTLGDIVKAKTSEVDKSAMPDYTKAFQYEIRGNVKNVKGGVVSVYAEANPHIISAEINEDGKFNLIGTSPVASQIMVSFDNEEHSTSYEFYLFGNSKIEVNIDAGGAEPSWKVTGVPKISEHHYEKIIMVQDAYISKLSTTENSDSLFRQLDTELTELLGRDEFANVTAKAVRLGLMDVLYNKEMKKIYDIYEMPEFKELPVNKEAFAGIPYYNNLMVYYNFKVLKDSLQIINNGKLNDIFFALSQAIDNIMQQLPMPVYLEMKRMSFSRFNDSEANREQKDNYFKEAEAFMSNYPNYKDMELLKKRYDQVKYSLIGKTAPAFTLLDTTGVKHKFPVTGGKYLLVDVWGSWCAPCRFYNKELVKIYTNLKETGKIEFISIAYDPDRSAWMQAIREDSLAWPQLYSTPEFIKEYHITSYPTTYLISPEGIVLKKGFFTEEELLDFID